MRRTVELERSNAELERFAGVVSHDLRQSLTAVSGFLALLESRFGAELPEGAAGLLLLARESSERMHALVDDLLAYARVGHSGRAPERVDVGELVHRIVPTAAAGAVLEIGDLPVVLARPREFEQLLANLIANGVKFVAPGVKPRVSVIAAPEGAAWRFEIADNGIGVAAPARAADLRHVRPLPRRRAVPRDRHRARDRPEGRRGGGWADLGPAARRRR